MNIFKEILEEVISLYDTLKCEIIRVALLATVGLFLLKPDAATLSLVSYSFGLSFLLIAASHLARKILFRRMDMAVLADAAVKDKNVAAALIFIAICVVLVALMFVMAAPLLR